MSKDTTSNDEVSWSMKFEQKQFAGLKRLKSGPSARLPEVRLFDVRLRR